ncbi:MAG TPA: adenylate/guanylate cyclase domain-containing protein [Solirubrobacteraceae bacterium]
MAPERTTGGVAEAIPRWAYRRASERYLEVLAANGAVGGVVVATFGIATTALYVDGSLHEYALLTGASYVWYLLDAIVAGAVTLAAGAPVRAWLRGARGEEAALAAWCAGAALPVRLARRPVAWIVGALAAGGWDVFAVTLLDLPLGAAAGLFPASFGLFAYWMIFRTLALELGLRPVLEELTPHLPATAELDAPRVPLRWRLLGTLPALCWGTGVVVGGVTSRLGSGAGTLAGANGVALAATAGVSIWLSLLLADAVAGPVTRLRDATVRVREGDLDVRAPVVSTDETGDLARSFNTMVGGLRERERLRDAFGAYVDPALTERVLREGVDLRGEELVVSVLFLDVRGFTTLSENATAQEVVARLNELYDEVVPVILRHGGHASKFIGDGLLAVFGAPRRLPDHADCAVAAAIEVARCVEHRFGGALRVGVGVNSGPVIAGPIGGGGRVDFTVIGDTVNTAARVESATRRTGDDVLVTEATVTLLGRDHGGFDERPPVPLKGKTAEVRLLAPRAVLGVGGGSRPAPA